MGGPSDRLVRWTLRVWLSIGASVLLAGVYWLLREPIALIVPPLAIGAVLIYLLNPAVAFLHRFGVPRPLGTLLTYIVAAGGVWFGLSLLGPVLVEQGRDLVEELPAIGAALQDSVNAQLVRFGVPTSSLLDLDVAGFTDAATEWIGQNRDQFLDLLRGAGTVVSWVVHLGLALALGPILAFYALSDLPRLSAGLARLLPPGRRDEAVDVTSHIGRIVGSYFRGQLAVAAFVGVATAIGLWAIGLPFWAVVGITTGVFNLVPLIGPTTGAVFGVLLALTVGSGLQQAILVVVVMVVVQQLDNHVITPLIVSRSVAIHPITVIVALVFAGSLGGIPLMFVAIPAVATLKLLLLHLAVTRLPSMRHLAAEFEDGTVAPRGTVASLAQELRRSFERRLASQAEATRQRFGLGDDESGSADDADDGTAPPVDDGEQPERAPTLSG